MRILLIHQAFASNNQAGGTRHYELGGYLVNRGHELVVIGSSVSYLTGDRSSGRSDVPGLRVLPSWTYATRSKGFVPRLASFLSFMLSSSLQGIKAKRVDVVWGTSPPIFQALSAYLVARVKRRPFVLEVRDLWPDFAVGLGVLRNPVLIRLSRWLERHLYKHAEVVVANSPGFEPHLLKSGVRRDRLRLVPNGVDIKLFPTTALNSELREEKGWSDRFVAMYTGAHGLANDLDVLIDAACLLSG
jgi:glycosyltransferase involved in cell wall biosynthesis